jgi:exodeoxyribonuclease V beta subunit
MNNKTLNFDLLNSKLDGTNLIEASAGTGKTYTITGLFLRLVVEKCVSVDQILVVTFTEAATEELRDRIRSTLRNVKAAFSGKKCDDEFLNSFVEKYQSVPNGPQLLNDAIRDFDQAAIFTIHGFCKRMLDENAFESGSLFDTELLTDQENLKKEIVQDFWRRHIYHESPLFVNFALANNFMPGDLLKLVSNRIIQPDFKVIPSVEIPATSSEEQEFQQAFAEVRTTWQTARSEIENILMNNENLNRSRYKPANIPIWIGLMDQTLAADGNDPMLFDRFEKFTFTEIKNATKKNCPVPQHQFFERCDRLKETQEKLVKVFEQRVLGLKVRLFNYLEQELDKRKIEKNIQSFDDLLLKLYHALNTAGGSDLADTIRKKFKAALIDEFQDTDPVQYAIFKNIFSHQDNILFLIGDPKQAIYGFRGADIFAYMDAARHSPSRYTLGQNWRSEPGLITAINHIFASSNLPFVFDEISFEPARAADKKDRVYLKVDNKLEPPFQLWYLDAGQFVEGNKPISKSDARSKIFPAVAAEISRLLNLSQMGKATIGERPLKEQDIAVLVRRNKEALLMQQSLSDLNIPAVVYSTNNLFDSYEAMEVQRILESIAEPNNETLLKAAFATDMIGLTGEEIDRLIENENEWEFRLVRFRNYHETWNQRGFIQMFRLFLAEENVLPKLMAFPDGERRNTNVLHLAEVLHQVSMEKKFGITELLKWLSEQRDSRTPRLEEHQLRLESDENAVKLVTIHKSKGLEYPIVFCPFTWDGSKIKSSVDELLFHDEKNNRKLTLDLGSENREENRIYAEKELLAENLRLLYVALTRAKHRCYLVWGRINEAETSAPAYLFHSVQSLEKENIVAEIGERVKQLTNDEIAAGLRTLANQADGTINLADMPIENGEIYLPFADKQFQLSPQRFKGQVDKQWRISSYSSLVYLQPHAAEQADYDAATLAGIAKQPAFEEPAIEQKPSGIFAFPRGTRAGIFLHKIFENLDFAEQDKTVIEHLVAEKLIEFGFEADWQETLCKMIRNVISTPLDDSHDNFPFSRIQNNQRLNELEFYFPLKSISPKKLKDIFSNHTITKFSENFPDWIGRLNFAPTRGFMKGFIDMVFQFENRFYIVDWKSNYLGSRIENYDQKSLQFDMAANFYFLQYHVYSVALNAYLKLRQPNYDYDKHFGGVFYIFLRGVDEEKGSDYGIFRDKPAAELIENLSRELLFSEH